MKSINKIFLGIFSLVVFLSCESNLETEPQQSVSTDAAFETLSDFTNAVNGLYTALLQDRYYGRNFPALMDGSSDNGNIPAGAGARLTVYYTMDLNPTNTSVTNWTQAYNVIGRTNQIINRIDDIPGEQNTRNVLKGQAYFVRALCHFDMMRVYAQDYNFTADHSHLGVPYVTGNEIGSPTRDDAATVFENILSDLGDAESLLATQVSVNLADRVSRMAALALRARVHLYMGDYSSALADADAVINSGNYTLSDYIILDGGGNPDPTQIDNWSTVIPMTESILEFQVTTNEFSGDARNVGLLEGLAAIYNRVDGYGDLGPSQNIVDLYDANDVRSAWYLNTGGVNFVNKYPGNDGNAREFTTPVLRLSEMVLIRAEALARTGQDGSAQTAVNLITARANAPAINSTGTTLVQDILDERRRELAFEGHRYGDIKRLQIDINRGAACTLTNGNCVVPYGDKLFAWPIPVEETDANPNMVQDPLWSAFLGN